MSGERKGERASARWTASECIDGALSSDKRILQSAQYGAGSSGFQNASIKAGIALVIPAPMNLQRHLIELRDPSRDSAQTVPNCARKDCHLIYLKRRGATAFRR